jgi:hypothetical protein
MNNMSVGDGRGDNYTELDPDEVQGENMSPIPEGDDNSEDEQKLQQSNSASQGY